MQNPTISVGEDLNREPGYTIFTLSDIEGDVDRISYSVIRQGYDLNYLGETAWQAAFTWLEPEDAWCENNKLKFIVPPDVTWQLEPQGYVLRLNLAPTIGEISFEFFWPVVLPIESTSQPSSAHRLFGTRVKPLGSGEPILNDAGSEWANPVQGANSDTENEDETEENVVAQPTALEVRENSKSANKAPAFFLIIAIIALLGGVYWFFLRPSTLDGRPTVQNGQQAQRPETAGNPSSKKTDETSGMPKKSDPIKSDNAKVQPRGGTHTEITEVTKPVVEPDKLKPSKEDVSLEDRLRAEMQTEETTQQTKYVEPIEPALRRQVGE